MSKILPATCVSGVVKIEGLPVEATIQSEGIASSTGVALVESGVVTYLAKTSTDLKDVLTQLDTILAQIITISTTLDGVSTSPGTTTAAISQLSALKATLATKKDALR